MKLTAAALVLLTFGACSSTAQPGNHLQYFGYAGTVSEEALTRTSGYTNIAYFGTTYTDPEFTARMGRLTAHGQKAILNIAPVLWDFSVMPPTPFPGWQTRWDTWMAANASALVPSRVLTIAPFDEPMGWGIDMKEYEAVCAYIKYRLPWVKILLVDGLSPASKANADAYIKAGGTLPNVDWLAIDEYAIHPNSNAEYLSAVALYKTSFPARQWFYVLDGFWDADHASAFGAGADINGMGTIAEEWYQLALADPDAVGLGVFIWDGGDTQNWIQSKDFPTLVLDAHRMIGDLIRLRPLADLKTAISAHRSRAVPTGTVSLQGFFTGKRIPNVGNVSVQVFQDGSDVQRAWTSTGYFRLDNLKVGKATVVSLSDGTCFNTSVPLQLHTGLNEINVQICP